jgi:hypothetical protein
MDDDFVREKGELSQFAVVGFARLGQYYNARWAYKRTHAYSAVVINVKLVDDMGMRYKPGVFVMEDIDFNERIQPALVCKCMRYMQKKKKILTGGCADYVARKEEQPTSPPVDDTPLSPAEPTSPPVEDTPLSPTEPASLPADDTHLSPASATAHLRALVKSARFPDVDDAVNRLERAGIGYEMLKDNYKSLNELKDDLTSDPPGFSAAQARAIWLVTGDLSV